MENMEQIIYFCLMPTMWYINNMTDSFIQMSKNSVSVEDIMSCSCSLVVLDQYFRY